MAPAKQKPHSLRTAVERAVVGTVLESRSRFLAWTAEPTLGPEVDPVFQYDLAALRHEAWRERCRLRGPPLAGLEKPTACMTQVAEDWGWRLLGPGVWHTPDGEVHLGWDGWGSLKAAAEAAWRRQL